MSITTPTLDRIDKEGQLATPLRILFGRPLHLTLGQVDAHVREHLTRLFKAQIARLLHRDPPTVCSRDRPAALAVLRHAGFLRANGFASQRSRR